MMKTGARTFVVCNRKTGMNRFIRDIKFMIGHSCGLYWKFCWFFFIPVALIAILAYSILSNEEPTYSNIQMPRAAICELATH